MGYCETADIKADFKKITFDSESAITPASLAEWIVQESNYIDARVGLRYVVPIDKTTYPEAFSLLKRIAIFRVSERVRSVIEVKTGTTQKDSDEKAQKNFVRTPNDDLDLIVKGLLLLKDVPLISANAGVNSFNVDECVSHVFDVRKQQW